MIRLPGPASLTGRRSRPYTGLVLGLGEPEFILITSIKILIIGVA